MSRVKHPKSSVQIAPHTLLSSESETLDVWTLDIGLSLNRAVLAQYLEGSV